MNQSVIGSDLGSTVSMDALRMLIPLNALRPEHLQQIQNKVSLLKVRSGHYLFREGDTDKRHTYLLSGSIELVSRDGSVKIVHATSAEAQHPIAHTQPRTVSARAASDVTFLEVDSELLDIMLTWDQTGTYQVLELETGRSEDEADWMTHLLQTEAFHRIPAANIQAIFMRMEPVSFRAGETVIRQGDVGEEFFIIRDGRCKVTRTSASNPEGVTLADLGVGDSFGEEALISDTRRNATVTMTTDGSLMRLSKEDFATLLQAPLIQQIGFKGAVNLVATQKAIWLDVRLPGEFNKQHIRGSINIPLIFLRKKAASLDKSSTYIVYCDSGRRSSAATFLLTERGYEAYLLEGGTSTIPQSAFVTESG